AAQSEQLKRFRFAISARPILPHLRFAGLPLPRRILCPDGKKSPSSLLSVVTYTDASTGSSRGAWSTLTPVPGTTPGGIAGEPTQVGDADGVYPPFTNSCTLFDTMV